MSGRQTIGRGWLGAAALAVAAAVSVVPVVAGADAGGEIAADGPVTSAPPSAGDAAGFERAVRGQGGGVAAEFGFVYLGRGGSVAAGFDRYYWMTAGGLGVASACTGSHTSAGHCTWAELFWARTGTAGGSYLSGDAVPMYFDRRSATVWLIFGPDAAVESGVWSGTQGRFSATVAVTCAAHEVFRVDDWPPSDRHDDIWHDVRVCEASLADMAEAGGMASVPLRPDDFDVRVLPGSDPISRAGSHTELTLGLRRATGALVFRGSAEPVPVTVPLSGVPVGAAVTHGPGAGAPVMCLAPPASRTDDPGNSSVCLTDPDGRITLRYMVPAAAGHALRSGRYTLVVFEDRDRDGVLDHRPGRVGHEPAAAVDIGVAKKINYVALGDSYSSGEAGRSGRPGFQGKYQTQTSPADDHCRRWSKAYPAILAEQFLGDDTLGTDVAFQTFACTGAVTHNIHDPRGPSSDVTQGDLVETNKPSHVVPSLRYDSDTGVLLTPPTGWEPRQAVSLADAQSMSDVDLVTVTVGGNDAGFAPTVVRCVTIGCGAVGSEVFEHIGNRVAAVLAHLRTAAPNASIFLLGYPAVTPAFEGCPAATTAMIDAFERTGRSDAFLSFGLSEACVSAIADYVERIRQCEPLDAGRAFHASEGWSAALRDALAFLFGDNLHVDAVEAIHLRAAAVGLNNALRDAAGSAGVHFVEVLDVAATAERGSSFGSHSPCDDAPWVHGVVVDDREPNATSGASFHPSAQGHREMARMLELDIRTRVAAGAPLTEAGLPANPPPRPGAGLRSPADVQEQGTQHSPDQVVSATADSAAAMASDTVGFLIQRRASSASGCGAAFVSPGEQVALTAGGFAAGATVTFATRAGSLDAAAVAAPALEATTADADGRISVIWTVPAVPDVSADAAPRSFGIEASGVNPSGGAHTARPGLPLVVYPGVVPCAVADAMSTSLGSAVRVDVLANDVAASGGLLDAGSVRVRGAAGGSFSVDAVSGSVSFVPDGGFWGTVETSYSVFDGWGVGVEANLTITVDPGCTITGTVDVVLIEGTDGDDVICVPDRDDWRAFYVIDAKGGDDVVLGGAGVEWIYGGAGADVVYGNGGDDRIVAGSGADTVYGGPGVDYVYSADLADRVIDSDGGFETVLSAESVAPSGPAAGPDWAWVGVSHTVDLDVLGNDHDPDGDLDPSTLRIAAPPASGAAAVVLAADGRSVVRFGAASVGGTVSFSYEVCDASARCSTATATVMVGTADCTIVGTAGRDVLRGTPGDDVICGLDGNDDIWGLDGDDIIVGGAGRDTIRGGTGDDTIWGGPGGDTAHGDSGDDAVWGGPGHDILAGGPGADRLSGGTGHDAVTGGDGSDRIWGGPGADSLIANSGDDAVWGGPGGDTLYGGNDSDTLWGGPGNDAIRGGAGNDTLYGGPGNDSLDGLKHHDTIWGGDGDDTLNGSHGDDRLWGGDGDDTLNGSHGDDHLDGGPDTDTCRNARTRADCE